MMHVLHSGADRSVGAADTSVRATSGATNSLAQVAKSNAGGLSNLKQITREAGEIRRVSKGGLESPPAGRIACHTKGNSPPTRH